jgi:hypothetical protein
MSFLTPYRCFVCNSSLSYGNINRWFQYDNGERVRATVCRSCDKNLNKGGK